AYRRAGFLRLDLKDWKEARDNFTKAIPVFEKRADDSADAEEFRHELARCCHGLSVSLAKMGRYQEAEPSCRQAIALLEKLVAQFPHAANYRVELGHSLWLLSARSIYSDTGILSSSGRFEEAEDIARAALMVFESLAADYPKERLYRQETAFSLRQLS